MAKKIDQGDLNDMLCLITVTAVVGLFLWQLVRKNPPKINNIYSQPGKWYWLKKWLFCVVLKLRKRKQATDKLIYNDVLTGGLTHGYGLGQKDPETMESIQSVDFDPFAIDTTYFAAFGTNGMNIVMRIARRPDRCGEIWLFLDLPGIGQYQHPVHPDVHIANNDSSSFNISGLQFQVLEPMKQWRITYTGLLRVGLHNDISEKNEKFASVQMSFIWTAFTDCFNFDTDMSSDLISDGIAKEPWTKQFYQKLESKHQTHYEQWGELRGRIKVEGFEEEKVCLKTVRDHTYGVRDWRAFHRYAIHFIWLETGLVAQIGVLCQPQIFTHLKIGYVSFPNADMVPITDVDLKLWEIGESGEPPEHYSFSFWADGQKFDVEVKGGMTPIWYHHEDRGNKILERFSTFKINGIPGRGLTEYCYRNFDGPRYIQDVSLPHLCEPLLKDLNEICQGATTVYFTDIAGCNSQIVGGKGSQLALLTRIQNQIKAVVPQGFCLTLMAFDKHIQKNKGILKKIDELGVLIRKSTVAEVQAICKDLVDMLTCTPIEESIVKDIHDCLSTLYTDYINTSLAVRSSAADEDGSEASSAGQMETFLGVKGTTQILEAVRKCWASAYTYQAVEYRRQHGQAIKTSVGVVIQKMVRSDVAGVLFTADPVNGDTSVMTINGNYGLGESVVSGKSDPDTIRIRREWKDKLTIMNKHIGDKQSLITLKENGGITEEGVETKDRAECCLTDKMILNLAQIAIMLEKYFGNSRDIEWAVKDDTLYLLQCRPITTAVQETEDDIIHEFDSAFSSDIECVTTGNIGEMMPGAVTPLTLSTFARSIDFSLQNFNFGMGARRGISSVMCGIKSCSNHLFISLFQTECIVLSVGSTKKEMAELALLGEVLSIITVDKLLKYVGKEEGIFLKIINFFKMLRMLSGGLRRTQEWEKRLPSYSIGVGCQDSVSLYQDISAKLTDYTMVWDCTINNSSRSSSWTSVLMSVLTKGSQEWKSEHYGDLAILLAQCVDVYSAEVPSAIQNLAKEIKDSGLREKFLQMSDVECVQVIYSGRHENLLTSFKQFLSRHGHRCVRESEIHEKSWQVEPEKLIKVIKAILLSQSYERPPKSTSNIADIIDQMKTELSAFQRWIIKFLLPRTWKAVGDREWGKSLSIEMSEKFKKAYWILADLLVDEGRIPEADLMFYLTHAEIGTLLKTRSARLIMRAGRRRKIHQKQMLYKFKKVVSGHPQLVEDGEEVTVSADYTWTGLPVSQGTAHGTARVVTTLQDAGNIQSGDILVVTCTDVGWSPYFPLINGLVTEVGGLISHGAVVAREYGIPCVVNICNATIQIKSGDQLYIDGKAGIVVRSCQ